MNLVNGTYDPSIPRPTDYHLYYLTGHTCRATDVCLTAGPRVPSTIQAPSHIFVEVDHEIISMVIILASAVSRRVIVIYKRKYVHVNWLTACSSLPRKKCG